MSESVRTHPVILTTRTNYAIPSSKYMIPTSWARYHLSQLINKVLSSTQPVPFDFLVNGELLIGSLAEWCNEHNVGEEETLEIEYIESVLPPEVLSSQETDDWTTSISCQYKNFFLTSSYDGSVRVHDSTQQPIATILSHTAPVTSACWVTEKSILSPDEEKIIASSSLDHTLHLNRLSSLSDPSWNTLASLHLHTAPVASVSASADGKHLISAGWDGLVGVWSTVIPEQDEVPEVEEVLGRKKRRKVQDQLSSAVRKGPAVVLKSHMARVSKSIFDPLHGSGKAYSCGWDGTVRSWDVESGVCLNTVTLPDRAHLDLAISRTGTAYVASADRSVSVIDLRLDGAQSTAKTLTHPSTPSCLVAHPDSAHHLLTGAHDGALRIWDIRSPRTSLAKFEHVVKDKTGSTRRGKILGVDWAHGLAACAGEVGFGIWNAGVEGEKPVRV
ncbi:Ribosome biogenesis protein YTM1 OS=Laccaria bicolor (strain S238N-H82 / ATCC MYA-4686) GN=YTM1 PE=3 SV=1 [Rhizoctonia solani AG-1 IB]|uniref:Ribosome biogenesis protein YTM1 n=1 Tax=Thanatephorus cucumeris (strain AG1-IB / isolate 7/3/14) TaxID=1108050 RepID=A0A0B7F6Q8_THACB|nr:Ribosome biogenesis protein YTM1 OS=Laccaria bicolor (strain S238N-H82 / ATCC MYA-4686) GN=YTM1 PE=3 SV=1 [Rhizoctonia solani AG-1 IB]